MAKDVSTKINEFFFQYRVRKYAKGQVLLLSGDQAEYVYYLVEGKVKQYDITYRGDEIILNVFKPPAFFPMSLVINKSSNPYIYEAETDIEIHQAPAHEVVQFLKDNPDVLFDLLSRVYHGVDGLLSRVTHLMANSAKSRLVLELVIESRRFGKQETDGETRLSISEKDLGARAGLSRETVSREIAKLKKENLVQIDKHIIVIKNFSALEKILDQTI